MTPRSLPIRVNPVVGESITSWLCALANRNHVTWQQMLTAVGLHRRRGDMKRLGWVGRLHRHEIDALATAIDIDAHTLSDMTFARFDDLAITTGRRPPRPEFGAIRGSHRPLRYCPRCLTQSAGRWQLRWSLGWSFACVEHECLLAEKCPECLRRPQRHAPLAGVIPDLTACGQLGRAGAPTHVCGADLRRAADTPATRDEVDAQQVIDSVIGGSTGDFTIYDQRTVTRSQILADLRVLARRILTYSPDPTIDLTVDEVQSATSNAMPGVARGVSAVYAGSAQSAAGLTAAVQVLGSPDIAAGAQRLRGRLAAAPVERWCSAFARSAVNPGRGTTAVPPALQLSAIGPRLCVTHQLRYRVWTQCPRAPRRPAAVLARVTRALPTLLWAEWAERIVEADCEETVMRAALSCAVALVGTDADVGTVVSLLGTHVTKAAIAATLRRLRSKAQWATTARIITELADHIAAQPNSIDYHRRRTLDYGSLLPDDEWTRICRDAAAMAELASDVDAARCVLFAHLSGWPVSQAPWFIDEPDFHHSCRCLVASANAGFAALEPSASKFLAGVGIDEPVSAMPALMSCDGHPSSAGVAAPGWFG